MNPRDRFKERIYDEQQKQLWLQSGLVRVDSLRKGDVFESQDGLFHIWDHLDLGTVRGKPYGHDEYDAHMVGSAMVRPVMTKSFVKPEVEL